MKNSNLILCHVTSLKVYGCIIISNAVSSCTCAVLLLLHQGKIKSAALYR